MPQACKDVRYRTLLDFASTLPLKRLENVEFLSRTKEPEELEALLRGAKAAGAHDAISYFSLALLLGRVLDVRRLGR